MLDSPRKTMENTHSVPTIVHFDPFSAGHSLDSASQPQPTLTFTPPQSQSTYQLNSALPQDLSQSQSSVVAQARSCASSREVIHEVKHRRRTTRPELKVLEEIYSGGDQKPNASLRKTLGERLRMSPRQVQVWFQNRRAKDKKLQADQLPAILPPTIPQRGSSPSLISLDQGSPNDPSKLRRGSLPTNVLPPPPTATDAFGRRHSLAVAYRHRASHPYRLPIAPSHESRQLEVVGAEYRHQGYFCHPTGPVPLALLPHTTPIHTRLPYTSPPRIVTQAIAGPLPVPDFSFGSSDTLLKSPEDEALVEEESLPYFTHDNWTRPRFGSFVSIPDSDSNSTSAYSRFGSIPGSTYSRFGSIPSDDHYLGSTGMGNTSNTSPVFLHRFSSMQMDRGSIPQVNPRVPPEFNPNYSFYHPSHSSIESHMPNPHENSLPINPYGNTPGPSSASSLPLISYDTFLQSRGNDPQGLQQQQSSTPPDSCFHSIPPSFHPYPTLTAPNECRHINISEPIINL